MPKLVKRLFRHLRNKAIFMRRMKRIARTKDKLHQNLKQIQEGQIIQANIKEMRVMSKMLHRTQYGTTKHSHHPLKLDITKHPSGGKIVSAHVVHKNHSHPDERHRG